MPISIQDKKRKIKETRSRAVQQKINLLRARDGSESPEIESAAEDDDFNLSQLFGGSMSSQINWTQLGVEGLIRVYYEIIYTLNGTIRNNPITNNREDPNGDACINSYERSDLTKTAEQILSGTAYKSGFFVGNDDGFENKSESDIITNSKAARGEYDLTSSSISHNRDKINISGVWKYPVEENNLLNDIQFVINKIGQPSSYGVKSDNGDSVDYDRAISLGWIHNSILGHRFTDVHPRDSHLVWETDDEGHQTSHIEYSYGNGSRDSNGQNDLSGFVANRDYYDTTLDDRLNEIKSKLQYIIQFLEYSKVDYDNFFMNTNIIPGRDDNWNMQIQMISNCNIIINNIDTYLSTYTTTTQIELDSLLNQLKSDMQEFDSILSTMTSTLDTIFGEPLDADSLYGIRLLWIKNLIDVQNGGSKLTLQSVDGSIEDANKKITQTEESYGIIGVTLKNDPLYSDQLYWENGLVTPIIGGIETHLALDTEQYLDEDETIVNENYMEMIQDGYIIAWEEVAHASAYTVYRSKDYDPITEQGNWEPLIPSGQNFTVENIDLNTGKVLSYYIDYDIDFEQEENPYYKIKTFDVGRKDENEYWWYGATSELSLPMSAQDFFAVPSSGTNIPGMSGPPPSKPNELPDYLFKYVTLKMGGESADFPINKSYTSDVEFDSIGSNLEIFVDGLKMNQGNEDSDYKILSSTDIKFNSPINSNSKVSMIVYFGSTSDGGSGSWKDPVSTLNQRPTINNKHGDVILVLENNTIYSWDENENDWYEISGAGGELTHTNLLDMPDSSGNNADHDARYLRRDEINIIQTELQTQLDNLSYLIPDNAAPLENNLEITNKQYYTGYLSGGSFNRFDTLSSYQLYNKIIFGDLIIIESVNKEAEFTDADKGILSLYINDLVVDSINLSDKFIEADRGGIQSWTPFSSDIIEITSIYAFNNYGQYQKCNFKLNIDKNYLTPGENKILLKHESETFSRESNTFIFFWDSNPTDMFFSQILVSEKMIGSQKYLSGIRYYSSGDQLNLQFTAQGMFDNSYIKGEQIYVDSSDLGINEYYIDYSDPYNTTDGTTPVSPNVGMPIWFNGWKSIDKTNICSVNPQLKLKGYKPYDESNEYIETFSNILINTYSKASDNKNEYFVDEVYRLPNGSYDVTPVTENQWDNKKLLSEGELMVFGGKLMYPNTNFNSSFLPQQNINYSGYTGEREYIRAFIDDGIPHNNGIFTIKGDIFYDSNVKIMMKLPNQTEWLDLKKPYNEADYTGSEEDGCLLQYIGNNFKWTSGGYSTALSGYMIILRVIMSNSDANSIEEISINW